MQLARKTLSLLASALLAACSTPLDLTGFADACLLAPSDAPVELEFDGERVAVARVPVVSDAMPQALHEVANRERPRDRTTRVYREWNVHGRSWRVVRQREGDDLSHELLLAEDGSVLEEVHPVATDRIPRDIVAAATARGLLRLQQAAIVRSELRPHHWRLACEDGAGRTHRVRSDLTGGDVRIARMAQATTIAW